MKLYLVIRGGIAINPYNPSLPIADGSLANLYVMITSYNI